MTKMSATRIDVRLLHAGVRRYNIPRATPEHSRYSHIVVAKVGSTVKTIRFGQQGAVTAGSPSRGESLHMQKRRHSFKARHAKNIAKGPLFPAWWADKVKW